MIKELGDGEGVVIEQKETTWFSSFKNSVKTINSKIKQLFITAETEEALSQINQLFTTFFKDVPFSHIEMFTGLLLLDISGELVEDKAFLRLGSHFMRFASASFGSKYVYSYLYTAKVTGFIQGVSGTDSLNVKGLCDHTGISKDDVVTYRWTSTNFDPGHYIAIDHSTKSIVLSIRGTFHARDLLSDLVATNTPFLDGLAHTGILKCAQNKFKELSPILIEQLEIHEGYKIAVVGHSLGGGTAALFTLLFNNEYPDLPIHCYAYAPPCVTSMEIALSPNCKKLIHSFTLNNDIIPRLSYQSLEHLKSLVCSILDNNTNIVQKSFQILAAGNSLGDEITNKIANFLKVSREVKIEEKKYTITNTTMLPPGDIYRIYKLSPFEKDFVMERSNPALFGEIIISGTLLSDHMPDNYETAFNSCLKLLNDITPESNIDDFVPLDDSSNISTTNKHVTDEGIIHETLTFQSATL
eukprot:gene17259-20568_t